MKICTKCGVEKPYREFNKRRASSDGLNTRCKSCLSNIRKKDSKRKAKDRQYKRDKYENDKEYRENRKSYSREWHVRNKSRSRDNQLSRKYGLNQEDLDDLINQQENRCAICGDEFQETPNIDHCHETGKVRGLLCRTCNVGLGHFKDNLELLQSAIRYLEETNRCVLRNPK